MSPRSSRRQKPVQASEQKYRSRILGTQQIWRRSERDWWESGNSLFLKLLITWPQFSAAILFSFNFAYVYTASRHRATWLSDCSTIRPRVSTLYREDFRRKVWQCRSIYYLRCATTRVREPWHRSKWRVWPRVADRWGNCLTRGVDERREGRRKPAACHYFYAATRLMKVVPLEEIHYYIM